MGHGGRILSILMLGLLVTGLGPPAEAQAQPVLSHVVQPGDTLVDLALFYGAAPDELIQINEGLDLPVSVGAGQLLSVPVAFEVPVEQAAVGGPFTYVVQRGDTLFRIAARFDTTVQAIAEANNLLNIDSIFVGQELFIPAGGAAVASSSGTELASGEPPAPTLLAGKQIVVSLHQQRTYAYEDGVLLRQFVISSGLPATPTVTGNFAIYLKYESQHMSGPGYSLPNVPWVMYFYRGYSFHGTYWHDNFGQPMSHGCVNMRIPEAEWLYHWAPIGTVVLVVD